MWGRGEDCLCGVEVDTCHTLAWRHASYLFGRGDDFGRPESVCPRKMMPSFFGSLHDAVKAGDRCLPCHWCGGHVWWAPEHELTEETRKAGRVFHCWGECEKKERAAREGEGK